MGNYQFVFGIYDDTLLEKVVDLFTSTFYWTNKFSMEYLRWQYLDNPNGTVLSFNAFAEDGLLAAHYAAIPIKMKLNGKIEDGLLSLNTATHPNHQGHGLFTKLANMTYSYAKENGYKYIIGVANANSTHGFLNKLGFYLVSPLDFKIGCGNVFKNEVRSDVNQVYYDNDILSWRLKCPEYQYSISRKMILGSRKEPLFHTCVAQVPKFSMDSIILKRTFNLFNIYIGLGVDTTNTCYFNLPKFIKRSPFNLIFKDLTDGQLPKITKDNIYFTLLDFDVA